MSWKCNSQIIEQNDIDYICHNKICIKGNFCELFILLLDITFKSPNGKLEYTMLPYEGNVQIVSGIKVQFLLYNYKFLYFVHVPYRLFY